MKNANPVSCTALAVVLLATAGVAACGREKPGSAVSTPKTVAHYFTINVGERPVRMQLAVQPVEMERGLMHRRDLGEHDGMLFVYVRSQRMSFWMRNTPTPLDIGFFSGDGILSEVRQLHPHDETAVSSRSDEMKFALEMNQGWFKANAVLPGAKLDLKALTEALKARGFEPARFGL